MVRTLSGLACKHLQSAYAGLQKLLQQEWEFVQRVTPDIGGAFRPVETALWYMFFLALVQGIVEVTPKQVVT